MGSDINERFLLKGDRCGDSLRNSFETDILVAKVCGANRAFKPSEVRPTSGIPNSFGKIVEEHELSEYSELVRCHIQLILLFTLSNFYYLT